MEIREALKIAAKQAGWNAMKVAIACDVTEKTAYRWLSGEKKPSVETFMKLRKALPQFADLVDGKAA